MPNAITVENLTKKYKLYKQANDRLKESLSFSQKSYHQVFLANNDISFKIKKGEVVGIIGKNGSGKSTLLKMITEVLTPSSGNISINGKITAMLELGAGFNPELSGIENLYLSGAISGFSKEQMMLKVDEIAEFADIGEFIHQPLKTYSSGMKARLGFAFAINSEPEILIIDEALSVGDVAFSRKCYARIESMCESNEITVLFVSHSGGVIKQLCSRAILLHLGELIIDGNPKYVVNLYEKFVGDKNVNVEKLKNEFEKLKIEAKKPQKEYKVSSSYNLGLKSKSMVRYKENGARIFDVKVVDLYGDECNILEFNKTYFYRYKIIFDNKYKNVNVAMFIKNKSGIEIVGKNVPINSRSIVAAGKEYTIQWEFKNIFNEGYYFLNCGVNSTIYGDKIVLHRIIDAYMFKSIKSEFNNSYGLIDIGIELKS